MNANRCDAEDEDSVVAVDENLLNQTDKESTENGDRNDDMHPVANMRKLVTLKLKWREKY